MEKKDELIKVLLKCTNYKSIAEAFALYGHYAVQMNDEEMFDFMLNFVFEHVNTWDTNTLLRNINAILSAINIIETQNKKNKAVRKCIK